LGSRRHNKPKKSCKKTYELINSFDLSKVQKGGAIFNVQKLDWVNKKYIDAMSTDEFIDATKQYNVPKSLIPLVKEKISKFSDIPELLSGELSFINSIGKYDKESLKWKQEPDLINTKIYLENIIDILGKITDFNKESVKSALWPLAEERGKGNVLWPMRYALSGKDKSPDPFTICEILGKDESIRRLKFAYELFD
jgi:glutamyl/glutaminyl-tRNA synthetase